MDQVKTNIATITGKLLKNVKPYYTTMGEKFFKVEVDVKRNSGEFDTLPVIISEKLLDEEILNSTYVSFVGQIRTFNRTGGSVDVFVFAKDVVAVETETYKNEVQFRGFLCKKGAYRTRQADRRVIDFILAVNRSFKKTDYLPILAWGHNAKFVNKKEIPVSFDVIGRFQSRKYLKRTASGEMVKKLAYEISSSQIIEVVETDI